MDQAEELEEAPGQGEGDEASVAAADNGATLKHDCIVNLWPYASSTHYYTEVLTGLACADKASVCIIASTTAHPAHWVTCAKQFQLETYVLTRRWSAHSAAHGLNLGKQIVRASVEASVGPPSVSARGPEISEKPCQCIAGVILTASEQVIEAYDVTQGTGWHDGLNRSIPAELLAASSAKLIRQEAAANNLRVTGVQPEKGRSLETMVSKRDGDIVCAASALYWDSWDGLLSFLRTPGNSCFADRIVQIDGVKHMQQDTTIWAVLVGVAQFAQHFDGYRPWANCILEFDPSRGFNNDEAPGAASVSAAALRLKVATRNGAYVLICTYHVQ